MTMTQISRQRDDSVAVGAEPTPVPAWPADTSDVFQTMLMEDMRTERRVSLTQAAIMVATAGIFAIRYISSYL